eukprot:g8253.t1
MGIGFSSSHLLEPSLFRDIPDVVERERLFELYGEWTIEDCQVAVERFAARHESRRRNEIDALDARIEEKEEALAARRPADNAGVATGKSFFGTAKKGKAKSKAKKGRGRGSKNEDTAVYDPMAERMERQLAAMRRERDERAQRTVDNSAVMSRVGWQEFYNVLSETEQLRKRTLREKERKTYNPATIGYVMAPDPEAQKMLDEFGRGQVERPGLRDHEIDGHTDDSASETESDSDEESGSGEDEEEDEEESEESEASDEYPDSDAGGSAADSEQAAARAEALAAEKAAEEARLQAALAEYESGDEQENELRRPKMVDRPLPDIFNPALCSPVFFGYTTDTVAHEAQEHAEQMAAEQASDKQVAERQKRAIKEMLAKGEAEDASKRESYVKRGELLAKQQDKEKSKRAAARRHAEKMLAPDDDFFPKWDADEKVELKKAAEATRAYEAQKGTLETLLRERAARRKKDAESLEAAESQDRPRGPQLMMQAQHDLERVVEALNAARTSLEDAERLLRLTSQEAKGKEKEMRSMVLKAEDDVARAEKECTAQLDELEVCEELLERAIKIQEREALFLPLWDYLVSPISYTVLLGELLFALALGCGKARLVERMRFNFQWFDVDDRHELGHSKVLAFIKIAIGVLEKIGDVRRQFLLSEDEAQSIAHRAFRFAEMDEFGDEG